MIKPSISCHCFWIWLLIAVKAVRITDLRNTISMKRERRWKSTLPPPLWGSTTKWEKQGEELKIGSGETEGGDGTQKSYWDKIPKVTALLHLDPCPLPYIQTISTHRARIQAMWNWKRTWKAGPSNEIYMCFDACVEEYEHMWQANFYDKSSGKNTHR